MRSVSRYCCILCPERFGVCELWNSKMSHYPMEIQIWRGLFIECALRMVGFPIMDCKVPKPVVPHGARKRERWAPIRDWLLT